MINYFKLLEKNKELFENAIGIAKEIAIKAKEIFKDCEVYIIGSYAKKIHTLSSDLDILITSTEIPEKINFQWYYEIIKTLTKDHRINIHLLNKKKLRNYKKMYTPMIRIVP